MAKRNIVDAWNDTLASEFASPDSRARALPKLGPQQMIHEYIDRTCWTRAGVVDMSSFSTLRATELTLTQSELPDDWDSVRDMAMSQFSAEFDHLYLCSYMDNTILKYDAQTMRLLPDGAGTMTVVPPDTMKALTRDFTLRPHYAYYWPTCLAFDYNGRDILVGACGSTALRQRCDDGSVVQCIDTLKGVNGGPGVGDMSIRAMAVDSNSNIYVRNFGFSVVHVFRADGHFMREISGDKTCPNTHTFTPGLAVNSNNHVIVCAYGPDARHDRLEVRQSDNTLVRYIDSPDVGASSAIVVDADDNILIADTFNKCVRAFRADGRFMGSIALPKLYEYDSEAHTPLAVDRQGRVMVAMPNVARIYRLDKAQPTPVTKNA